MSTICGTGHSVSVGDWLAMLRVMQAASRRYHLDVILTRTSYMSTCRKADSPSRVEYFYARPGFVVELCFQLLLCHRMASNYGGSTNKRLSNTKDRQMLWACFKTAKIVRALVPETFAELLTGGTLVVN